MVWQSHLWWFECDLALDWLNFDLYTLISWLTLTIFQEQLEKDYVHNLRPPKRLSQLFFSLQMFSWFKLVGLDEAQRCSWPTRVPFLGLGLELHTSELETWTLHIRTWTWFSKYFLHFSLIENTDSESEIPNHLLWKSIRAVNIGSSLFSKLRGIE